MKAIVFALFFGVTAVACATAQITEPSACDTQSVSFNAPSIPAIPSQFQSAATCSSFSVSIPAESTTTDLNLSDAISKLSKVTTNLNVNVTALTIDNSQHLLDWANDLDVFVQSKGGSLPQMKLAHYTKAMPGPSVLEVAVVMNGDDMLKYLSTSLTATITINGATVTACDAQSLVAAGNVNSAINLCVSVSGTVSKSL